jgi:hypothetical protein
MMREAHETGDSRVVHNALPPASRARALIIWLTWGLRPRLYAAVGFADCGEAVLEPAKQAKA